MHKTKSCPGFLPSICFLFVSVLALSGCSTRYDEPMTYKEAVRKTGHSSFPTGSSIIYFASFSGGQARAEYIRFDAPVDECLQYVRSSSDSTNFITAAGDVRYSKTYFDSLPWFDIESIETGMYYSVGWRMTYYVDTKRGRLYTARTD